MEGATPGRRSVTVELDQGSDPLTGSVAGSTGPRREFSGWLELIAALQHEATTEEDVCVRGPSGQAQSW
jgi:hypothetical protein